MVLMPYEVRSGPWLISDDRARLDLDAVHAYLTQSYWTPGISREQVERQTTHSSVVFGMYGDTEGQVGFARVLSDLTRFAYICDVYIRPDAQGQGLGKLLM